VNIDPWWFVVVAAFSFAAGMAVFALLGGCPGALAP